MFAICLHHERRWIQIHLSDEVAQGVLYADQALHTSSFSTRSTLLSILKFGPSLTFQRRRLLRLATDLANLKRRRERFGETPGLAGEIERTRAFVGQLSKTDPLVLSQVIRERRILLPPLPPTRRLPPPLPG